MKRLIERYRTWRLYRVAKRDPGAAIGAGAYFLGWDAIEKANPENEHSAEVMREAAEDMAERIMDTGLSAYEDYELPGRLLEYAEMRRR